MTIDIKKVFWAFWKSSWCYMYPETNYAALYDVSVQVDSVRDGDRLINPIYPNYFGKFDIYPTKKKGNKTMITQSQPLFTVTYKNSMFTVSKHEFILIGLRMVFDQYNKKEENITSTVIQQS